MKKQCIVAIALIKNKQGKIFAQRRNNAKDSKEYRGRWEFPGGRIEFGEDPETTIKREVKEEINCEVEIVRLLPYVHSNTWEKQAHVVAICYECRIIKGLPKPNNREVGEIRWVTKEQARSLDFLPGNMKYIEMC